MQEEREGEVRDVYDDYDYNDSNTTIDELVGCLKRDKESIPIVAQNNNNY